MLNFTYMNFDHTPPPTVLTDLKKTYEINATPAEVFESLVNPDVIQIWSEDEATMNDCVGKEFA